MVRNELRGEVVYKDVRDVLGTKYHHSITSISSSLKPTNVFNHLIYPIFSFSFLQDFDFEFQLQSHNYLNLNTQSPNNIRMQYIIATLTTLALFSPTSASPITLFSRATCGTSPAGTGSATPISQPTNIQTAQACQTLCTANTDCQSFVFGMVDTTIKCLLFSSPASQVPSQGSTNLIAFDKACTSVPTVKPTTADPTGANTSNTNTKGQGGATSPTGQQKRDTCAAAPAGSNKDTTPLSQLTGIESIADCKKRCQVNTGCKSFIFAANECELFSVSASAVPAPTSGQSAQVFDVGCVV
jgi:hypothetical protein